MDRCSVRVPKRRFVTTVCSFAQIRAVQERLGMTVIEATVILSILVILAGALAPVLSDSISSARSVRAKNDLSQIAIGLVNLNRDVGGLIPMSGTALRQISGERLAAVEVLVSGGNMPLVNPSSAGASRSLTILPSPALMAGETLMRQWADLPEEALDDHLRRNLRQYPVGLGGSGNGWNGPYVSRPIESDPWGNRYLVNACFLALTPPHGHARARAVFVLSAGPDGVIETPFDQPIENASAFGDDLIVRIQ